MTCNLSLNVMPHIQWCFMRVMSTMFVMHALCGAKKAFQKINFYYDFFCYSFLKDFQLFYYKRKKWKFQTLLHRIGLLKVGDSSCYKKCEVIKTYRHVHVIRFKDNIRRPASKHLEYPYTIKKASI